MNSGAFDVVIFPDLKISTQAIEVSKLAAKWDSYFELSETGPYAHISLYQAEFPFSNLDEVKSSLALLAEKNTSFNLNTVKPPYRQENETYIEIQYEVSKDIANLHESVMKKLSPLRNGLLRTVDINRFDTLDVEQKANLEKWGYRFTGRLFRPHITITRVKNSDALPLNELPDMNFNFKVSKIGLFKLGAHGTCIEEVAVFDLG